MKQLFATTVGAPKQPEGHSSMTLRAMRNLFFALGLAALAGLGLAKDNTADYLLGPGDTIRIQVFQNPDLTLETRVTESGTITYPLIGSVNVGSITPSDAEKRIANQLKEGGFVQQPQVTVVLLQNRGNQVSVLGLVNRPGRFPLETFNTRLTEMLAMAGGISPSGADTVIIVGLRNGKPMRKEIDIVGLFLDKGMAEDITVSGGDVIYVNRAPVYYVYGEVQRPGSYRVERGMTVMQALAQGGGPTMRGTDSRLRLHRRGDDGVIATISPALSDPIQADDVLYINESLF
jgi:polysaccharide export outer membrane protein